MFACWKGNDVIVKMLVDAGADVNAVSATGATPLIFAANAGKQEMVNFLLAKGARTDAKVMGHTPALVYALKSKNPQMVAAIAKQSSPEILNLKNKKGETFLLSAIKANNLDFVKALLSGKQNLEEVDKFGQTALMYASRFGRTKILINLLNNGANPNTKDQNGITALTKAALSKNKEVQMTLIKRGGRGKK